MDNARRNKQYGIPDGEARVDVAKLADKVRRPRALSKQSVFTRTIGSKLPLYHISKRNIYDLSEEVSNELYL